MDGLSFTLEAGESLGLVGGTEVNTVPERQLRALRGAVAAMVFQDPLSSLDPYYAVGDQISEVYRVHTRASRRAARKELTRGMAAA